MLSISQYAQKSFRQLFLESDNRRAPAQWFFTNWLIWPLIWLACDERSLSRGISFGSTCCASKEAQMLRKPGRLRRAAAGHRPPPRELKPAQRAALCHFAARREGALRSVVDPERPATGRSPPAA